MSCVAKVHFRFACQTTISFYAGLTGVTEEEWDGLDYWEKKRNGTRTFSGQECENTAKGFG